MIDKFEIVVPAPPLVVFQRLQSARKDLAPTIGTGNYTCEDSSFSCPVNFSSANALVKGKPAANDQHTLVVVETSTLYFGPKPNGLEKYPALFLVVVVFGLLLLYLVKPAATIDSSYPFFPWFPIFCLGATVVCRLLATIEKNFLKRFIRETLREET